MNAFVALPPGVVTTTLAGPTVPAGALQVMLVVEVTETLVAFTPPKVTDVTPETKPVPVIVTLVPPNGPESGETEEIVRGET